MLLNSPPLKFSAHIGFLFNEMAFDDRFEAAHMAGFSAVEHPSPFRTPASKVAKLLNENGLVFVQTGFPAGDPAKGEKGFAALRDRRDDFRGSINKTLDYAGEIGCKMLHTMAGIVPSGASHHVMWEDYIENLGFVADAALSHGIDIIIEPIGPGTIANYFIAQPTVAVDALRTVNRPNVKILFDVFHSVSVGTEPISFIAEYSSEIGHVQIADYPGRHEPGSAIVDFDKVFAALNQCAYVGHVGCEYHPSGVTTDSFGWMEKWRSEQR